MRSLALAMRAQRRPLRCAVHATCTSFGTDCRAPAAADAPLRYTHSVTNARGDVAVALKGLSGALSGKEC